MSYNPPEPAMYQQFEYSGSPDLPGSSMQQPTSAVYRQNSYPMPYYAPMPMAQNMMPAHGYMQPQPMYAAGPAYSPDMMGQGYPVQMIPTNMIGANGQPMYQIVYSQPTTGMHPGQYQY